MLNVEQCGRAEGTRGGDDALCHSSRGRGRDRSASRLFEMPGGVEVAGSTSFDVAGQDGRGQHPQCSKGGTCIWVV